MARTPTLEELEQRIRELEEREADRKRLEQELRESEERFLHSMVEYLPDENGKPYKSFGYIQDVTEPRRTREHLRLLSLAVDQSTEGIAIVELDGRVTFVNKAFAALHGYRVPELAGKHLSIFHTPEQMPSVDEANRRIREDGRFTGEIWHAHRDGSVFPTLMENSLVLDEGGEPVGMIATLRDITDLKRAEKALREERDFSNTLIQSSPAFFVAIDPDGRTRMMNETMLTALGYSREEVLGAPYLETFVPEPDRERLSSVFNGLKQGTGPTLNENRVLARDGRELRVEWYGNPVMAENGKVDFFFGFGIDITERRRMESEIAKVQRLEALGILAGGIAHDFNNILTAILANISMSRAYGDLKEEIADMLLDAEKASLQARNLTQQLLTFAKGGTPVRKTVSLAGTLKDTAEFALSGSRTRCHLSIPSDLWPVEADEGQIGQVVQNLMINADQAMPRGGTITLRAENTAIGPGDVPPLEGGPYVKISVVDQGTGIARKDLPHIFDPFFTTKQKGSGLGLATAFSIVSHHGGHLCVESEVEKGASFHLYLPASVHGPAPETEGPKRSFRGQGKILVIDDEEIIRKTVSEMLRLMGYDAGTAQDHEEGIALYREAIRENRRYAAVIMDLTIPGGMGGQEAVLRIRQIDPKARVIVSSGYSHDPVMSRFREYGFCGVVAKPYRVEDLAEAVRAALEPEPG